MPRLRDHRQDGDALAEPSHPTRRGPGIKDFLEAVGLSGCLQIQGTYAPSVTQLTIRSLNCSHTSAQGEGCKRFGLTVGLLGSMDLKVQLFSVSTLIKNEAIMNGYHRYVAHSRVLTWRCAACRDAYCEPLCLSYTPRQA